jgi:hypothetical protein
LRTTDQYLATVHADRQPVKRFSLARSANAKSGCGFVQRAVRVTHEMPTIFAKELVAHEIQWSGHVPAAIHVSVKAPLIVNEESINAIFIAYKPKLFNPTGRHFLYLRNNSASLATVLLHAPLIATEKQPVNNQSHDVENKKEKRQIKGGGHAAGGSYLESLSTEFLIRFTSCGVWRPAIPMIRINSVVISAVI